MNRELIWNLVEMGICGYKVISQQEFEEGTKNKKEDVYYFYNKTLNGEDLQFVEVFTNGMSSVDILLKLQMEQNKIGLEQNRIKNMLLKMQYEQNQVMKDLRNKVNNIFWIIIIMIILSFIASAKI